MATGSGKTFVAIMLILKIFGMDINQGKLKKLSNYELQQKKDLNVEKTSQSKKVAFLVPTTNLVEQQADAINQYTNLRVGKYSGAHQKSTKNLTGEKIHENWKH